MAGLFNANDHLSTGAGIESLSVLKNGEGAWEFAFQGLLAGREYRLMRGSNLESFPDEVEAKTAEDGSEVFVDAESPAGRAFFYRLEAVVTPK